MRINKQLKMASFALALVLFTIAAPVLAAAGDEPDLATITAIRQEGFRRSQVMEILSDLTDMIGPRLTGSPSMKKSNEWTRDKLTSFGLTNARLEPWGTFDRGWSNEFVSVRMLAPDVAMLQAFPKAWSPGTDGVVKAGAILINVTKPEDLEKYRGKVAGKIVLVGAAKDLKPREEVESERYDDKKLAEIVNYTVGNRYEGQRATILAQRALAKAVTKFLAEEKALAAIEPSRGEGGMMFVQGTSAYKKDESPGIPSLVMSPEHYGRLARLLGRETPVELELDVRNKWYDNVQQFNTVAEIPGTDKKDEVVMLGGHLDSWHSGTGTTDNATGVAVVMEAVRILKALDLKPRRTIRVGLWGGEEQGLLGSRGYVTEHFGNRERVLTAGMNPETPEYLRPLGKLTLKPEQAKLCAYFNLDNGTGRIRGIYAQENAAVRPIFEKWLEPFADLGAHSVTMRNTSGTDHLSFDMVGIPAFQFIQDPIEYETITHHSNLDVYERAQKEDLMQAAVIMASFIYNAAMRDEMLPRKPLEKPLPEQLKTHVAGSTPAQPKGSGRGN
ncbi:MAG TPA: M20/M25/M40 family metallo-hydrolase [Terriglobales bacterium]|nr:M20/M25/M40 family metallo-hydrolase [Terriglobales bacterium]